MIPDSIIKLLETGVSILVGTRDTSLLPECTRAWGIHVAPGRHAVRIFLSETFAGKTIDNLRENGMIAVTCTRPTDHITCQLKGRVRKIRALTPAERDRCRRWHRDFAVELRAVGVPASLPEGWIVEPTVAVEFAVSEIFDQTPGPGAGRKIGK
jgi:hypothetical protein